MATQPLPPPTADFLTFAQQPRATAWRTEICARPSTQNNRLLAALPADEWQRLSPHLERVTLEARRVLASPEQPVRYVYFPHDAVVSFLVPMEDGSAAEGATIGNEGMVGLQVFLGDVTAREEIVPLVTGEALRMRSSLFKEAVRWSPALQTLLHGYTQALMNQITRTAGCNRVHTVDQRCARVLLMSRDRVGRDTFPITHECLATMLAVRRASVTEAAGVLQQAGLIHYRRGQMTVCDRDGLDAVACEDYRLTREAYDRLYDSRSACISSVSLRMTSTPA